MKSLDCALLLSSAVLFAQFLATSATCNIDLQRNRTLTLQEPAPLIRSPGYVINSPGCGRHVRFRATKNGSAVPRKDLPWMVLLVTRTVSGVYRYCGGTIITRRHVLTAGHCTFYTKQDPIANIKVYYEEKSLQGNYRRVARFLRHPKFDMSTLRNDIAILMVDDCFEFGKYAAPICLPTSSIDVVRSPSLEASWQVQTSGAGVLFADILGVRTAAACHLGDASFEGSASFCGVGAATCKDDSAAAVFIRGRGGRSLQVGVLSYSADCSSSTAAKVFTRIDIYVPWITQNIEYHEKYEPLLLAIL